MKTYKCDDGHAEIEINAVSARAAAQEYVDTEDWGEVTSTLRIDVRVWEGEDDGEWYSVDIEPPEPECTDDEDHDLSNTDDRRRDDMPIPKKQISIRLDQKLIDFFEKYGGGSAIMGIRRAARVLFSIHEGVKLLPGTPAAEALERAEKLADL